MRRLDGLQAALDYQVFSKCLLIPKRGCVEAVDEVFERGEHVLTGSGAESADAESVLRGGSTRSPPSPTLLFHHHHVRHRILHDSDDLFHASANDTDEFRCLCANCRRYWWPGSMMMIYPGNAHTLILRNVYLPSAPARCQSPSHRQQHHRQDAHQADRSKMWEVCFDPEEKLRGDVENGWTDLELCASHWWCSH
ncbi:hypothetical protein FA95DRAFT_255325 [Auriscalpium vulgare]|uniref:Uncharacterized protein n=1 Tax=Auriscalpium vulgare TaxID=40419 RepID=A0ACB8RKI2_9AGAM|nr:hypothetical protein FA95DRAFT_255325 [Auriscalpium vulgare]